MHTVDILKECPDFAAICKRAKKKESDYDVAKGKTADDKVTICLRKLRLIYKQFNGGKKPDRANTNQGKYYPFCLVKKDSKAPFGFRLSFFVCDCDDDCTAFGARPYLLDSDDVKPVFEQFKAEHEELEHWNNVANQE